MPIETTGRSVRHPAITDRFKFVVRVAFVQ